jgi:hypothetical protein
MAGPTRLHIKLAQKYGRKKGIKPSDLLDLMEHESGFNPAAVSSANAQGLTQFIPGTAKMYGVQYGTSRKAQKTQVRGAARYLKDEGWGKSETSIRGALAAYYGAASPYADALLSSEKYAQYDKGMVKGGIPQVRKKSETQKKRVLTSPAESFAGDRAAAALAFIQDEDKDFTDYLSFAETMKGLKDQPAQYKTKKSSVADKVGGVKGSTTPMPSKVKGKVNVVKLGKLAESMGLHVGEHPKWGGVEPVHATNSFHYQGRAIDVSGSPEAMRKFANRVKKLYGPKLAELFWNGSGAANVDNGAEVGKGYVSGHTDHVHVAV